MTIPSTERRAGPFMGNGVANEFPFTFKVFSTSDISVSLADTDRVETAGVLGSSYTVTLNADQNTSPGGTVRYAVAGVETPLPTGYRLAIQGDRAYEQQTQLPQGSNFNPVVIERSLDVLTILVQQLRDELNRSVRITALSPGTTDATLPIPQGLALLGWNDDGTELQNYAIDTEVSTSLLEADLASKVSIIKGGSKIGQNAILNYARGTAGFKLNTFITPEDYPFLAVGDDTTDDTTALQAFYQYLADNGGIGLLTRTYKITAQITLSSTNAKRFTVFAARGARVNLRAASNVSAFGFVGPVGVHHHGLRLDCGYSNTGFSSHGMSFRNAVDCTWHDMEVTNYRNTAILTFVDADDTYGDCHIVNCKADGSGSGQNGFLHEGMLHSSIQNCRVKGLDAAGSPCVGLQLKNRCKYSWIEGGYAEGCKSGVALGGDGVTFGDGPFKCWIRGVITKDCLDGATIGKSTDCTVDIYADQTNSPAPGVLTGYALNVAGANLNLQCVLRAKGVQAGRTTILVRSSDVSIYVPYANGIGSKLLEMSAGVNRCRVTVQDIADAAVINLADYVTDNSGTSTNEITFIRDLPGGSLTGANFIKLPTPGKPQNWMSVNGSTEVINWRINGTDRMSLSSTTLRPATDNSLDVGTASFRVKQYYGVNTTISTSDEREKQDIEHVTDEILDAWAEVQWVSFRWKDAVEEKGDDARVHFGLIAQRVHEAFAARGLDPFRYGVLCFDEWDDVWEDELNDRGQPTGAKILVLRAGNRFGVRYDQAFALEGALTRRELTALRATRKTRKAA